MGSRAWRLKQQLQEISHHLAFVKLHNSTHIGRKNPCLVYNKFIFQKEKEVNKLDFSWMLKLNQQKFCLLFWCPSIGEQKINQVVASRAFPFNLAFLCIFPLLISYFLHLFYETSLAQREATLIMRLFENFNPSCIIIKVRINKEGVEAQKKFI